ncbi:CoA transferase [Klebsiella aerogenes]
MLSPSSSMQLFSRMWQDFSASSVPPIDFRHPGALSSCFAVSDFAAASMGIAAAYLARLCSTSATPRVDRRLATYWFSASARPHNRPAQQLWDPLAGDYQTEDGWIRLHTNAPHHRLAVAQILGQHATRQTLAQQVRQWHSHALEQAVVENGGCAAAMRSAEEWRAHPQGIAVSRQPLLIEADSPPGPSVAWPLSPSRPLLGIRVLDLTRIIAGPVATRFLAGLGADVLRIDPVDWQESTLEEEITLGKRCARLNIKTQTDKQRLITLISQADVIVHGYRADALDALGLDCHTRAALSPGIVDVSLNAWGWEGPWRNRRGFDSLVQMACGIAHAGQRWRDADKPIPLPVQALDHATGYLMAAAVLKGIAQRIESGKGYHARLSLARVAASLMEWPGARHEMPFTPLQRRDFQSAMEWSTFGLAERLTFPIRLAGTPIIWSRPPCRLGSAAPEW